MNTLYHRFLSEAWAITEQGALAFQARFKYEAPARTNPRCDFDGNTIRDTEWTAGGSVAIIPVDGVLIHRAGFVEIGNGARAHEQIGNSLVEAAGRRPKAIILDIHSPGGTASGTGELAATVKDIASRVPTYGFTSSLTASAAYWIGSSCRQLFATPGACVGSIGAILSTITVARLLQEIGIDYRAFTSAPATLKGTGDPCAPLSQAGADYLQSHVNQCGAMFTQAVRQSRPAVRDEAFDGRVFFAQQAKELGLIDGIVGSIGDVVNMAAGNAPTLSTPAAMADPVRAEFGDDQAGYDAWKKAEAAGARVYGSKRSVTTGSIDQQGKINIS